MNTTISEGRRVLTAEAEALGALGASLDETFSRAVEAIKGIRGRVIVTGMGKSGHVGCKLAATLASTGTPAQFVHPAEASHGDLGMITPSDVVLALSNSGNTPEMGNLLAYTRRFQIPLIAITSGAESELATLADILLLLPNLPEACPLNLAPMTSTTMMLALGDALASALMAARGFSKEDFKNYHPGGKLGHRLLKVSELMHRGDELPLCAPNASMKDVLVLMSQKGFGCVGVADKNMLLGIITDGDLRRHMSDNLLAQRADAVMTANPKTILPGALAAEALAIMNEKNITTLFVLENGAVKGLLHIHDLLRAGVA
jgi:arabinose-5-phosphate isomerase